MTLVMLIVVTLVTQRLHEQGKPIPIIGHIPAGFNPFVRHTLPALLIMPMLPRRCPSPAGPVCLCVLRDQVAPKINHFGLPFGTVRNQSRPRLPLTRHPS